MKANTKNITVQELTANELQTISGGAANSVSMSLSSSADSLLSLEFNWQQGDNYRNYKVSAGNDVHAGLDVFFNRK